MRLFKNKMPRAKRHYIPGQIWHITHRCHKGEFLLKLTKDQKRWVQWLYEAKVRYGLLILNYTVTSNHIHLLVLDNGNGDVIPNSMQLVAGRTGQEYNQRKKRKGAYWEDRYHATAVETGHHFLRCLVYIDLNMVRTGQIKHPSEWKFGGYEEIQNPKRKCKIIAHATLAEVAGFDTYDLFKKSHRDWVDELLKNGKNVRDSQWSESVAVGSENFIKEIKEKMVGKAKGRKIQESNDAFQLREPFSPYNGVLAPKNEGIGPLNTYF